MPVFEEPVMEEIPVTQEKSVTQDSHVSNVVTQANTVTQGTVVRDSDMTHSSGVTQGSETVRDSKMEQNVTQGGGPTMKDQLQKTESITQQQNVTHSKQHSTTKDEEKTSSCAVNKQARNEHC